MAGKKTFMLIAPLAAFLLCFPAAAQTDATSAESPSQRKVALVIGNAQYKGSFEQLANPVNDARDMQAKLREIGFDVDCVTDADRKTMYDKFKTFYSKIKDADIALLYYSGHGIGVGTENYLIPVKADIRTEADLDSDAIPLNRVIDNSLGAIGSGSGNLIVILDACRNNSFAATRGASRGLTVIDAAPVTGYIIAYACKPGSTASDGDGRHSPFTDSLLQHIDEPDTSFTAILQTVRKEVMQNTGNAQIPSVSLETSTEIFLNGSNAVSPRRNPSVVTEDGMSAAYIVIIALLILILIAVIVLFLLLTAAGRTAVSVASQKIGSGVRAGRKKAGQAASLVRTTLGSAARNAAASVASLTKKSGGSPVTGDATAGASDTPVTPDAHLSSVLDAVPVGDSLLAATTPVTVGQYRAVMGIGQPDAADIMLPVTGVDFYDALSFLNALSERDKLEPVYDLSDRSAVQELPGKNGWRLPTRKEWIRMAGKLPRDSFGDSVWFADNSGDSLHPCAQKQPNGLGLYDMYGLVWEWCGDTLKDGWRLVAGGSWDSSRTSCSAAAAEAVVPSYRSDNTGFRGVRNR